MLPALKKLEILKAPMSTQNFQGRLVISHVFLLCSMCRIPEDNQEKIDKNLQIPKHIF